MSLHTSRILSGFRVAAAALSLLAIAGCVDNQDMAKHQRPLSKATLVALKASDMDKQSPILIRIYKEDSELEVWKATSTGRFAHFKTYEICAWSGGLGPKKKEGDRQAPEGFYTITPAQMNPNSSYHLSFNIGYPNTYDRAYGRTGQHLMVHGACSSAGCYAMTDEVIQEIYSLARESFRGGQRAFQVQALPFRMTPENMAKHADDPNMPFWRNLKEGVDHFEVTGVPPEVGVCERKYVFDAEPADGQRMDPISVCPKLETPESIRVAVAQKQMRDDMAFQVALAEIRGQGTQAGPTAPAGDSNFLSRIMVAGRQAPLEDQGDAADYSEPVQVAAAAAEVSSDPARAASPQVVPGVTSEPASTATAFTAAAEPFAGAVTGVWSRIVDMARTGLDADSTTSGSDPIETGSVPGQTTQLPAPGSTGSLTNAFAPPQLFASDPFKAFKMFETVNGVSVPSDTVAR